MPTGANPPSQVPPGSTGGQNHNREQRNKDKDSSQGINGQHIGLHGVRHKFDQETVSFVLEDIRLSTLQRKLSRESNDSVAQALAIQISQSITYPDNRGYVKRSTDVLCDAIVHVFYSKHTRRVKRESVAALARVGYVVADQKEVEKFYTWLWSVYEKASSHESVQILILECISKFLSLRPTLSEIEIHRVMEDLQESLEKTENGLYVVPLVDGLAEIASWRPKMFEPCFQDVVDILVGWHIDCSQEPFVRSHMSKVLLSWHAFWIVDMNFSSSLLRQFMEDLEAFYEDVKTAKKSEMKEHCERILSLIQVFNTVLCCLKSPQTTVSFLPPESSDWCETILDCFLATLKKRMDEDILVAGQHAFLMLTERIDSLYEKHKTKLDEYTLVNLDNYNNLTWEGKVSVMKYVTKILVVVDSDMQSRLMSRILAGRDSPLTQAVQSMNKKVQDAAVEMARSLMKSKSIIVLQEVYGFLTSVLEAALTNLAEIPAFSKSKLKIPRLSSQQSDNALHFVLATLSDVASGKGSVLSMWALDPSIFHLFNRDVGILNVALMKSSPWAHHALVKFLYFHCSFHGFFISSSSLLSDPNGSMLSSPTSTYFQNVLVTVGSLMEESPNLSSATLSLVMKWSAELLCKMKATSGLLLDLEECKKILLAFSMLSMKTSNKKVALDSLTLIRDCLQDTNKASVDPTLLLKFRSTFSYHLRSAWGDVRQLADDLLKDMPPPMSCDRKEQISLQAHDYVTVQKKIIRQTPFKDISQADFKAFIEVVLKGPTTPSLNSKEHAIKIKRHLEKNFPQNKEAVSCFLNVMTNEDLKALWIGQRLSHFCVNGKLKTPLGKAQDTLTTIEKVIRNLAQELNDEKQGIQRQECLNLLQYHSCLEKTLCNAFDGSSVTLTPPSKPICVFFSANKRTCVEWLSRLRLAVIELAYHTESFTYVVKNAHEVLPRLVANKSPQGDEQFALVVAYLASALTRLRNFDGLAGLLTWCREKANKKLRWLKCVIDVVKGNTEKGLSNLKAALQIDAQQDLPKSARDVVCNELYQSCVMLSHYEEFEKFMNEHRDTFSLRKRQLKEDYLKALSDFGDGAIKTTEWSESVEESKNKLFNTEDYVLSSHLQMIEMAACFQRNFNKLPTWSESEKLSKGLKSLEENFKILRRDHSLLASLSKQQEIAILGQVNEELANLIRNQPGSLETLLSLSQSCNTSQQLVLVKNWGEFFLKYRKGNAQAHFQVAALNLEIAKQARKENNQSMAMSLLQKVLFGGAVLSSEGDLTTQLSQLSYRNMILSLDRATCLRQCAKLCFTAEQPVLAVSTICGIASTVGTMFYHNSSNPELLETSSRALLNLTRAFDADQTLLDNVYPDMTTTNDVTLMNVLELEENMAGVLDYLPLIDKATEAEMVIGRLLRLSVVQSPMLAKTWHAYAEWSLSLGEKIIAGNEKESLSLTNEERQEVTEALGNADKYQIEQVLLLLRRRHLGNAQKAEIESSRWEFMQKELLECEALKDADEDVRFRVHTVWETVQKRTFFYHDMAVAAFFQYIVLSNGENEDKLIATTLRLLQLIVKYALELQESLQEGLENTPSEKWRAIIPQLFSRLNHPVQVVQNRISELLCRISLDFPHLIIFPAVVGAGDVASSRKISKFLDTLVDDDEDQGEKDLEEKEKAEEKAKPNMRGAYSKIVDTMVKQNRAGVEQVKQLVDELQRISLLWDELWLGTLQQYNNDINKRIKKMEDEVKKLSKNKTLSKEEKELLVLDKYNILFRPLLYVLDKIHSVTSQEPETPHEVWFAKKYGDFIKNMMGKLHNPGNPNKPKDYWGMLSQLQANLGSKLLTKTSLKINEISPSLHKTKKSHIPMPGVWNKPDLTMDSIDNTLTILLTKTKPKRLAFAGNDGKKYTYLFKGLEDLHLDERIMQFLSIANIMLKRKSEGNHLKARHYSVIPLGPRSGLIQWVGGATPMFQLFKKWQTRQQLPLANDKANIEKRGFAFQKPSELFYNKIYPLLREEGITNFDSRKSWPTAILKRVMQELQHETPSNIFSQELWFSSVDSQHWYNMVQNITVSFAVMSVIGYIIGLGDRHMDNLLLDLNKGEIIHIDYNVCFEKGKNLRIPEQVPCRLTQNIVALFGLTGVEGLFRNVCEATLDALRKGKDTLMTLLEAFVYDPLVDWTPGVDMGVAGAYQGGRQNDKMGAEMQDKREMQSEITFSMLTVRIAEMRGPWMENLQELQGVISTLEDRLGTWMDVMVAIEAVNEYLSKMHHSMSVLKEAESNPNHRLYTLHGRYIEHNLMVNAEQNCQQRLAAFVEDNDRWIHMHQRSVAALSQSQLVKWTEDISLISTAMTGNTSILVNDFLQNAGQSSLLDQFQSVESALIVSKTKVQRDLQACLNVLNVHTTFSGLYPSSYAKHHRNAMFSKYAKEVSANFTDAQVQEIINAFSVEFTDDTEERRLRQAHVVNINYQMENWSSELSFRLHNIFMRLANEKIDSANPLMSVMTELNQAKLDLQQYLSGESEEVRALMKDLFVMNHLPGVCRKFLDLEVMANDATEGNFLELTSGDGEWYLSDDIHMQVGQVAQILDAMDLLGLLPADIVAGQGLQKLQVVINQLQHFNSNFFGIVMQEGLKSFQKEDQSVIGLAIQLAEIINEAGLSLEELIQELDVEIRYAVSGIPSANETAVIVAMSVKEKYQTLIKDIGKTQERENLSPGQMLLLAFDSLFNSIDAALADLKATVVAVDTPDEWEGVDVIAESAAMRDKTLNPELFSLLDVTMFMQRLHVIKEYFTLCTRSMMVFKADASQLGQMLPTGDEIARPVKIFMSEYYRRQLLGVGSYCLSNFLCHYTAVSEPQLLTNLPDKDSTTKLAIEELSKAYIDIKLAKPGRDRSQYLSLEIQNLCNLMKKMEIAKYLSQNVEALQANQHCNQQQHISFQWFHADFIVSNLMSPSRSDTLSELTSYLNVLSMDTEEMSLLQAKYQEIHDTVKSRLKWASGANPEMQELLDLFSASFVSEMESVKLLVSIWKSAHSSTTALLRHEALRTRGNEAQNADASFVALMSECQQSADLREQQKTSSLSDQELSLFTLSPPADMINAQWIRETEGVIAGCVRKAQEKLQSEQERSKAAVISLQESGKQVRNVITDHQKLMSDAGALLRTISKSEDYSIPEVQAYLAKYKDFSELVSTVVSDCKRDDQKEESVREIVGATDKLKETLGTIYEDILDFAVLLREDNLDSFKVKKAEEGAGRFLSKGAESSEEKNAFALNVLRRVRLKLEGREPDALRRATVQEQVDFIIREATSIDNLSLMYEGWTSWI